MKRITLVAAVASLAGHDRAITRMSPQGLAHQQGTQHANPAVRNPNAATPAIPATPHPGAGPATPATPAVPANKPPKEPKPPKTHGDD
jgi:hypothetical protein